MKSDADRKPNSGLFRINYPYGNHVVILHYGGQDLQTFDHLTEYRVYAVQMARVGLAQHQKKLAAAGIATGVSH